MARFIVVASTDERIKDEKRSWDEYCDDYANYLLDTQEGRIVASDSMEPEDVSFFRDLIWIPDELNKLDAEIKALKAQLENKTTNKGS